MKKYPAELITKWLKNEDGIAALEATFVFPILLVLLLGTFDMGNAILSNQKLIRASQVTGDLITRERSVNTSLIDEAVEAGRLAMVPQDTSSFGIDIVSLRFDENSLPVIVWRETRNMSPNPDIIDKASSLGEPGAGVVVVTVRYLFNPVFADFIIGDMQMEEMSFTRGRKTAVVNRV